MTTVKIHRFKQRYETFSDLCVYDCFVTANDHTALYLKLDGNLAALLNSVKAAPTPVAFVNDRSVIRVVRLEAFLEGGVVQEVPE